MKDRKKLYEGKAKAIFTFPENPNLVVQHFKDDITAGNNEKSSKIPGKVQLFLPVEWGTGGQRGASWCSSRADRRAAAA